MSTLLPAPGSPSRPGLRELLARRRPLLAPGCYDALGGRLIEEAGFDAAYMTGFGTAAGQLGRPDVGLLTMSEMVANAGRIAEAISIPLIADADTGYGNAISVIRCVREYERAGVAAIHLEDQVAPKKCGHMDGKQVIPAAEAADKIRAAVDARKSEEFLIIARTDARAVEGLEAAIERGHRFREAGADIVFIEAPQSEAEIGAVAAAFPDVPLLFNWAEGGKTPPVSYDVLAERGFALIIFPITTMLAAVTGMRAALARIRSEGSPASLLGGFPSFGEFTDFIGLPEVRSLEARYGSRPGPVAVP